MKHVKKGLLLAALMVILMAAPVKAQAGFWSNLWHALTDNTSDPTAGIYHGVKTNGVTHN